MLGQPSRWAAAGSHRRRRPPWPAVARAERRVGGWRATSATRTARQIWRPQREGVEKFWGAWPDRGAAIPSADFHRAAPPPRPTPPRPVGARRSRAGLAGEAGGGVRTRGDGQQLFPRPPASVASPHAGKEPLPPRPTAPLSMISSLRSSHPSLPASMRCDGLVGPRAASLTQTAHNSSRALKTWRPSRFLPPSLPRTASGCE